MIARRFSVSTSLRWALRNMAVVSVAIASVALFAHLELKQRITRDVKLLLELEVEELVEELSHGALNAATVEREVAEELAARSDPKLQISVQVFARDGNLVYGRGLLADRGFALPEEVRSAGTRTVFAELDLGEGVPYWVVTSSARHGFVQVGISSREFLASAGRLGDLFLAAAPVLMVVTALMGWWLARLSLRPVEEITQSARGISFSQLDQRIPTSGTDDELDRLTATLNAMIARIESGAEKLREVASDAAHQMRTPVTRLRSRLEVAIAEGGPEEALREALVRSLDDVEALSDTLTATLLLAESEAGLKPDQVERVSVQALLEAVVEFYRPMAEVSNIGLSLDADREAVIEGNASWLRQLFSNLIHNAIRNARSSIRIHMDASDPQEVVTQIQDDGVGIEAGEIPRLFDRYYRRSVGSDNPGSGLGLPIALQIARSHGGRIDVASTPPAGATFSVVLPRVVPLS